MASDEKEGWKHTLQPVDGHVREFKLYLVGSEKREDVQERR